ncbi:MAG: hypothetical protein HZA10_03125 [Nitrospirae bacterium]|nr:hypothetical protein [Nitrospirota bacterium]
MSSKDICIVCAWRADCKKKFTVSGKDIRCPDFTRDVSLTDREADRDRETDRESGNDKDRHKG